MIYRFWLIAIWVSTGMYATAQQRHGHHYSTEAEIGRSLCPDTLHFLSIKKGYEVGVILPSWVSVISPDSVTILEGVVNYNRSDGTDGPHVSHEELPFYHYTHDMCAEIIPDSTPDSRYTDLLPYLVSTGADGKKDTTLQRGIDMEWESGLAAGNFINPCTPLNNAGRSAGFFSAGHERRDILWNWPAMGDWLHVEGEYGWDRGHPPAQCEIHPPRLLAVKRQLPAKYKTQDGSMKFATRVDVFASGDGGALMNNRAGAKPFVRRVKMSSKDYQFTFKVNFKRPSARAELRVEVEKHKGDSYPADEKILVYDNGTVSVSIPWQSKNIADTAIYARTVYAYWNEGTGVSASDTIDEFHIDLKNLYLKKMSEMGGPASLRIFVNAGSDWIFLNDFLSKGNKILSAGLGRTWRKHWALSDSFTIYVPRHSLFRVCMMGWEADGVDHLMGGLMDPASPCDQHTRHFLKQRFFSIANMLFRGCEDDEIKESSSIYSYNSSFEKGGVCTISPQSGRSTDPCPYSSYDFKDRYFFTYCIFKK